MREMTDFEAGWVVGIIEGEGSFSGSAGREGGKRYARVEVVSTDIDVVQRLLSWTGIGYINGPYRHTTFQKEAKSVKPQWRWRVGRQEDIRPLFERIAPHLSKRRLEQLRRAFT
jgi:hypothetical protein